MSAESQLFNGHAYVMDVTSQNLRADEMTVIMHPYN